MGYLKHHKLNVTKCFVFLNYAGFTANLGPVEVLKKTSSLDMRGEIVIFSNLIHFSPLRP